MHKTSRIKQTVVYIKKNFRLFMNQKDWKFIIIAAVISLLVCMVVGDKMFETYESTKSGFFCYHIRCDMDRCIQLHTGDMQGT